MREPIGSRVLFPEVPASLDRNGPLSFASVRPTVPEALTRAPDHPPNLLLPGPRRRYGGLALSVLLHVALLGLILTQGERLWRRTLAPGAPSLFPVAGGGGGGNRVAYITLPSAPPPAPRMPTMAPAAVPTPAVAEAPVAMPAPPAEQRWCRGRAGGRDRSGDGQRRG
jgi:hypothetical protein